MSESPNVLAFPAQDPWKNKGRSLGKRMRDGDESVLWEVGDWWNDPERRNDRVDIVHGRGDHGDWTGPTYTTCRTAGSIAERWTLLNRFNSLSFKHHMLAAPERLREVADTFMQWCLETEPPRPTAQLQKRIKDWDTEQSKLAVAARALAAPQMADRYRLVEAPVEALFREPPNSIDRIVTDPPYPEGFVPLYGQLARGAAHVLRPGGLLIVMCGQAHLPDVMTQLESAALSYLWTLAYLTPGGQAVQVFPRKVNTFWKPVLVFSQGAYDGDWYGDVVKSDVNDNDKEHHHWGQSVSGMTDLMKRFVLPGHTVCDPFLGGGTTAVVALELGASFLGFDIDPQALLTTRARIADAEY